MLSIFLSYHKNALFALTRDWNPTLGIQPGIGRAPPQITGLSDCQAGIQAGFHASYWLGSDPGSEGVSSTDDSLVADERSSSDID
jgi:hypothetical protein